MINMFIQNTGTEHLRCSRLLFVSPVLKCKGFEREEEWHEAQKTDQAVAYDRA